MLCALGLLALLDLLARRESALSAYVWRNTAQASAPSPRLLRQSKLIWCMLDVTSRFSCDAGLQLREHISVSSRCNALKGGYACLSCNTRLTSWYAQGAPGQGCWVWQEWITTACLMPSGEALSDRAALLPGLQHLLLPQAFQTVIHVATFRSKL
jgi:hypothetical protein